MDDMFEIDDERNSHHRQYQSHDKVCSKSRGEICVGLALVPLMIGDGDESSSDGIQGYGEQRRISHHRVGQSRKAVRFGSHSTDDERCDDEADAHIDGKVHQ